MTKRKRKAGQSEGKSKPNSSAESASADPNPSNSTGSDLFSQTLPKLNELPSLSRILSVVMLILGIIAVGALFYKVMAGFFVPLFLAALLVVIFRPLHQWIFTRTGGKPRVSAMLTTLLVLFVVLLPIILVISVATSQFTAMVSHVKFNDLSAALERGRSQLGISMKYPEQFRRLDELTDSLDGTEDSAKVISKVNETLTLLDFLQKEEPGPASAEAEAEIARERLQQLVTSYQGQASDTSDETEEAINKLNAEEEFHRQSVIASAGIRSWMKAKLGGTFRSQIRLFANPSAEDFKNFLNQGRKSLQPRFVSLTSDAGSYLVQAVIGLLVLVVSVYFFLVDGSAMIHTLMRLSPLDDNYEERLLMEFDRTSRAVVLASVLSALVQGLLAAIAFWMLGFDSIILLFLVTSLMALVPFLGAASVWAPCALYLGAVEERWTAAIILAIYGATIVSSIDNVIKMQVLQGHSTLHPLFALLSVLGGVKVFGPIGILVGPMVVVFLQTLLEILNHELAGRDAAEATQITTGE